MDYNINDFVDILRQRMYVAFPNLPYRGLNRSGSYKHGSYNQEIRDVAFMANPLQIIGSDMIVFDIGNDFAERFYPYYHILEDAPVIHKRNKSTEQSRGSEDKVTKLSKRDYNYVGWNGKSFTKEYAKNVRGKRKSVIDNSQQVINGKIVNRESSTYKNEHYHYIENMLAKVIPLVAADFDLKLLRTKSSGLIDEYLSESYDDPLGYDEMSNLIAQVTGM